MRSKGWFANELGGWGLSPCHAVHLGHRQGLTMLLLYRYLVIPLKLGQLFPSHNDNLGLLSSKKREHTS